MKNFNFMNKKMLLIISILALFTFQTEEASFTFMPKNILPTFNSLKTVIINHIKKNKMIISAAALMGSVYHLYGIMNPIFPLIEAVKKNNTKKVQELIALGKNPIQRFIYHYIFKQEIDINAQDNEGKTALMHAIQADDKIFILFAKEETIDQEKIDFNQKSFFSHIAPVDKKLKILIEQIPNFQNFIQKIESNLINDFLNFAKNGANEQGKITKDSPQWRKFLETLTLFINAYDHKRCNKNWLQSPRVVSIILETMQKILKEEDKFHDFSRLIQIYAKTLYEINQTSKDRVHESLNSALVPYNKQENSYDPEYIKNKFKDIEFILHD